MASTARCTSTRSPTTKSASRSTAPRYVGGDRLDPGHHPRAARYGQASAATPATPSPGSTTPRRSAPTTTSPSAGLPIPRRPPLDGLRVQARSGPQDPARPGSGGRGDSDDAPGSAAASPPTETVSSPARRRRSWGWARVGDWWRARRLHPAPRPAADKITLRIAWTNDPDNLNPFIGAETSPQR